MTPRLEVLESRTVLSRADANFAALALDPNSYDFSTILVRFHPGADTPQPLAGTGLGQAISLVPGLYTVRLQPGVTVADALAAYQASPLVQYAEPSWRVVMNSDPNDPGYEQQCALPLIQAPAAWDVHTGSTNTVVALIDTGLDYNHPDLANNTWINQGEIPAERLANLTDVDGDGRITFLDLSDKVNQGKGKITDVNQDGQITAADILAEMEGELGGWANGVDDDGNGRDDDLSGWNFVANSRFSGDDNGHGSHVAGIIGAEGNNGSGIAGINWRTQIMPAKFLDASGGGTLANALLALDYSVANGARVSSNGWGGGGFQQAFFDALTAARDVGHIFVTAAGSNGVNIDERPQYPASYGVENVVVTTTSNCLDQHAAFANFGVNTVDLTAPGVGIYSTYLGGGYRVLSGSSMAQAHVAGALALLWDYLPELGYHEVIDQVLATVDPLDPPCLTATCGRLNLGRALGGRQPGSEPGPGFDGAALAVLLKKTEARVAFLFPTP